MGPRRGYPGWAGPLLASSVCNSAWRRKEFYNQSLSHTQKQTTHGIKLWTPLLKTSSPGVGNASSGGTPASVGHSYAFGNTEEKARRLNMGCKARGQPGQPFSHKTGHGYVKAHRGFYHDAIFVKRNNFNLLLHETFGGGFSPTAVLKLRRLARKVARGSVDRTAYSPKYSLSFMSHHAERISLSVVRGVNRAIRSHLATLSARLARA